MKFKQETLAWAHITDISKKNQAIVVALNLPEDDQQKIKEKVFDEIGLDDLHSENGLSILFENLDKHLSKDELYDILDKFEDFENFVRKNGQSINEYVALFDSKYKKVLKKSLVLPSEILAFRLINRANITRHERLLILSGFDFENRSSLYEQAVKLLKKFIGALEVSKEMGSVRLEPAYLASGGWMKPKPYRQINARRIVSHVRGCRDKGFSDNQFSENHKGARRKAINPMRVDGQALKCLSCGSYRHLLDACPDSWENMKNLYRTRGHGVESNTLNHREKRQCRNREQKSFEYGVATLLT